MVETPGMHVTAKADYAIRAVVELVDSSQERPSTIDAVAQAQGISPSFLKLWVGLYPKPGPIRPICVCAKASCGVPPRCRVGPSPVALDRTGQTTNVAGPSGACSAGK